MIRQKVSRIPAMVGWPGGIGCALLGAVVVMSLGLIRPAWQDNARLTEEIHREEKRLLQPDSSKSAVEVKQRLKSFVDSLPQHDTINDTLNQLHELAVVHHLALTNSEYRPGRISGAEVIGELRIKVKIEGAYSDLRSFFREVPQQFPALALQQWTFSRQKISDIRLNVIAEFTLFYTQPELIKR